MKNNKPKYSGSFFLPFLILVVLLPVVTLICISVGGTCVSPMELFNDESTLRILLELRFYRLLTAFTVGGGLAVAGVAYQAVLRNPLAEPFILGISGGASVGAAVAISTGLAAMSFIFIPMTSFFGGLTVLLIVMFLARGAGAEYSTNIMLSGVIVGSVCSSVLMFMISVMNVETLRSVTWWMLGSLQPGNRGLMYAVLGITISGTIVLFLFGREANVMSMGEEMAFHFGVSPKVSGGVILGIASLLAASSVALSGIIGFVGLIIPHILRRCFGADHRRLFILAIFSGGIFLMVCDTFARTVLYPQEIPVGVITASLGGPFFIWLLNRKKNL